MLKSFPIDGDRIRFIAIDSQPVQDYDADGTRNGRQRADQDGVLLWRLNCLATVEGVPGGETVPVRIASDYQPAVAPLSEVRFTNLTARPWSQGERSGVALVADGIEGTDTPTRARKAAEATAGGES
jgi:hypothetical protein